tara:strand:+ start:729 stop:977 length:249 start_codon:yes stop_codon:yes gene_type:complete
MSSLERLNEVGMDPVSALFEISLQRREEHIEEKKVSQDASQYQMHHQSVASISEGREKRKSEGRREKRREEERREERVKRRE